MNFGNLRSTSAAGSISVFLEANCSPSHYSRGGDKTRAKRTLVPRSTDCSFSPASEARANTEPLTVAKLLHQIVLQEQPELILLGKQAIDDDCNQTGQMLAELCSYSQATYASKLSVGSNSLVVTREVDQGLETLEIDLPAIVTVDLRLNDPRYVKLPDIMKAKKKSLDVINPNDLKISMDPFFKVISVTAPPPRESGIRLSDAGELFDALKAKGLVD